MVFRFSEKKTYNSYENPHGLSEIGIEKATFPLIYRTIIRFPKKET